MTERVWQLVSRTTVGREILSRPRVAMVLLMLALLIAAQGVGAAESTVTVPSDGVTTEEAQIDVGP